MTEPTSRVSDLSDQARQLAGVAEGDIAAVASSAARLVQRAGTILEEELSMSLGALDRLESKYVDVEGIRDPETHELINRFRADAHQIIDLIVDIVGTSLDAVGKVADDGISIGLPIGRLTNTLTGNRAAPSSVNGGSTGKVSVLESHAPVERGGTATLSMAVTNSSDTPTAPFSLVCSDLVSETGDRIVSERVTFQPDRVVIAAGAAEQVSILVDVPADAAAGRYSGLVQATNLDHVRAVLTVTVT